MCREVRKERVHANDIVGAGADLFADKDEDKDEEEETTDAMITDPGKESCWRSTSTKSKTKQKIQIFVDSQVRRRGRLGRVCRESNGSLTPTWLSCARNNTRSKDNCLGTHCGTLSAASTSTSSTAAKKDNSKSDERQKVGREEEEEGSEEGGERRCE